MRLTEGDDVSGAIFSTTVATEVRLASGRRGLGRGGTTFLRLILFRHPCLRSTSLENSGRMISASRSLEVSRH